MTRGQAKGMGMVLEDKVQMVCHRAGNMGSIKDTRHRMLTGEERRVHGAEGQRLMVRPPTDKTDGTNKEAVRQKGSVYQQALKQALGA